MRFCFIIGAVIVSTLTSFADQTNSSSAPANAPYVDENGVEVYYGSPKTVLNTNSSSQKNEVPEELKYQIRINPFRAVFLGWTSIDGAYAVSHKLGIGLTYQNLNRDFFDMSAYGLQTIHPLTGKLFASGWFLNPRFEYWHGITADKGFGFLAYSPFEDEDNFTGYTLGVHGGRQWYWDHFNTAVSVGGTKAWLASSKTKYRRTQEQANKYNNFVINLSFEIKAGVSF